MASKYDIIGDIHGQSEKLKALLIKMGYKLNADGYFAHPERQVIFVGDFIDRYPKQKEVLAIVKSMVEGGAAKAVMGNHEFNAICFATKTSDGEHVREHNDKNKRQHKAFLDELPLGSDEHKEHIEWFKTLPVFLDLKEIFVVHACWCPKSIEKIKPYLNDNGTLIERAYTDYAQKDTEYYKSIEIILKGPEHKLPQDVFFHDGSGAKRNRARVSWWQDKSLKTVERLRECNADKMSAKQLDILNKTSIGIEFNTPAKPTFIGHYWMTGAPLPLTEKVCCVDYSAAREGDLVAYRWSGERKLSKRNFIW